MTGRMQDSSAIVNHISVCVCTFRRPDLLVRLLIALDAQVSEGRFTFSVVVVDNDVRESARDAVASHATAAKTEIRYVIEPEQNIALARNRAVSHAYGEFVAMIDDDEVPGPKWLLIMYRTLCAHSAHGVLGPVKPHFESIPPPWLVRGAFCERPSYATGTVLREPRQTRTGNALLRRSILREEEGPFDARFGRTGGEDADFFSRRLRKGDRFVWCDEAPVFESVPSSRMTRSYFLRRALLRGVANAENVSPFSLDVAKSVLASLVYTAMLPLLLVRQDVFMRYLIRDCDHIGKVLAVYGIRPVRERGSI